MTEREKQIAIIGAVALVVVLLLLFARKGGAQSVVQTASEMAPITNVYQGGVTFPPRAAINIPGLPSDAFSERLSAIGACCSDCSGSKPRESYIPQGERMTFVYNAASRGPNIVNNYALPYVAPRGIYSVMMRS